MFKKLFFALAAFAFSAPVFAQMNRHEFSLSYGLAPSTYWVDYSVGALINGVAPDAIKTTTWGAVTAGYNFRVTRNISVGAQAVYSLNNLAANGSTENIDAHYWSVMPGVKWNWINLRIVSFYSRVAAGLTFASMEADGEKESRTQFAFQASPIGVEVGGKLAGYAEAGLGCSGSLIFGVRYRF